MMSEFVRVLRRQLEHVRVIGRECCVGVCVRVCLCLCLCLCLCVCVLSVYMRLWMWMGTEVSGQVGVERLLFLVLVGWVGQEEYILVLVLCAHEVLVPPAIFGFRQIAKAQTHIYELAHTQICVHANADTHRKQETSVDLGVRR